MGRKGALTHAGGIMTARKERQLNETQNETQQAVQALLKIQNKMQEALNTQATLESSLDMEEMCIIVNLPEGMRRMFKDARVLHCILESASVNMGATRFDDYFELDLRLIVRRPTR